MTDPKTDHPILFFDGVCNLCNGFVQTIIRLDPKGKFRFASLQSEEAQELLRDHKLDPNDLNTVILLDGSRTYTESDVALEVARILGGAWLLLYPLRYLPSRFRDGIYRWVARNRYQWFGKKDQCMVPTPELKNRFL